MASSTPVYYELSWSILSTIGIANVMFGLTVVGITSLSPVTAIPIVVSAAGAVANGLCYYAYYADYPLQSRIVAGAFADVLWLIQEAGLSFYSYVILQRVLQRRARLLFLILFWLLVGVITVLRIMILATRVRLLLSETGDLQHTINALHIGYFVAIAAIEITSAVFLLKKFSGAKSNKFALSSNLFKYLMRSTEIRLALLALIGITRAVTYSFQSTAQSATSAASQLDRFVYTLECLFPIMMIIDILASKLVFARDAHEYSSRGVRYPRSRGIGGLDERDIGMYPMNRTGEIRTHIQGGTPDSAKKERRDTGSSTEHIIDMEGHGEGSLGSGGSISAGQISKTVEFEIRESVAV